MCRAITEIFHTGFGIDRQVGCADTFALLTIEQTQAMKIGVEINPGRIAIKKRAGDTSSRSKRRHKRRDRQEAIHQRADRESARGPHFQEAGRPQPHQSRAAPDAGSVA